MRLVPFFFAVATLCAQVPPFNSQGVTMGHQHFLVKDPEVHKKIWIEVLGAKTVKAGALEVLTLPDVVLAFRKGDPSGGTVGTSVDHIGFKTRDLAETKAKLIAVGCSIVKDMPEIKQTFMMFPDGIKVEFIEDKTMSVPYRHHHIHFATPQVEEMRAWYAKMFGAIPGQRGKFKAADLPGVNLSWISADTPQLPTKGRSLDHIGFDVKNLKEYCAKMEAQGVKFDVPYKDMPQIHLKIAFFTDPWGTYVELTEGLFGL